LKSIKKTRDLNLKFGSANELEWLDDVYSSKRELVSLLINAEQYIAEQNQIWLKNEFEKYI
jgi:hypothetical protein